MFLLRKDTFFQHVNYVFVLEMDMKIKLYQLFSISLLLFFPTFLLLLNVQNQNTIMKIGVRSHSESVPALEEKVGEAVSRLSSVGNSDGATAPRKIVDC